MWMIWMVAFWILVIMLFLIRAAPPCLLKAASWFCWFAAMQIGILFGSLPRDELLVLPKALLHGNPLAFGLVGMLAALAAMFFFYKELFVACEVKLAKYTERAKR
jgi:hypothetical protein